MQQVADSGFLLSAGCHRAVVQLPVPCLQRMKAAAAAYCSCHETILRAIGADSSKQDVVSLRVSQEVPSRVPAVT
jgi:hypothetical protein